MGIIKIVQGLSKMLHETIVDYYVKNVFLFCLQFTVYDLWFTVYNLRFTVYGLQLK